MSEPNDNITNEIKDLIKEFVTLNLPKDFKTVYWQTSRYEAPKKPFCLLTWLSDGEDLNSSEITLPNTLTKEHREYKTAVITIALYVDGLKTKQHNLKEREDLAQLNAEKLCTLFQLVKTAYKFKTKFAPKNTSGIRPLDEAVSGGYTFRREFDLTIGYDKIYHYDLPVSNGVNFKLNDKIYFEVRPGAEGGNGNDEFSLSPLSARSKKRKDDIK